MYDIHYILPMNHIYLNVLIYHAILMLYYNYNSYVGLID